MAVCSKNLPWFGVIRTSNNMQLTAAFQAGLYVDGEHTKKAVKVQLKMRNAGDGIQKPSLQWAEFGL